MPKPNYGFQKRQKELAKQQKREAKAQRRQERQERGTIDPQPDPETTSPGEIPNDEQV